MVTKMAHVATLGRSSKVIQNSGINSDDDDDFLGYDFSATPGGNSIFKPSLGDDYQIGHFSQDHSTQTNRFEVIPVKKLTATTDDLLKDAVLLKRDLGFIRCSMQADFELKLKQKSVELYVRMNERLAALEKIHAEKVETIRSAYRQQLCDAIVQIHGFYNSDFKKKMKSHQLRASIDDGELKKLKATNDTMEATIQSLMDRLAECESRDRGAVVPAVVTETREVVRDDCAALREKIDLLQQKINVLEQHRAAEERARTDLQEKLDKMSRLLADAQRKIDRLNMDNTDLLIKSSSNTDLFGQQMDEEARRAQMQREGYEAALKRLLQEKKNSEELLNKERAAAEEWRKKLRECEELNKADLDLAAEIERLKRELQQVTNAWKKKFAILQDSMRVLRDECYMRQMLHRKATLLHAASVSYTYDTPVDCRKKRTKQGSCSAPNFNKTARTPRPDVGRQSAGDYVSYTVTPPVDRKTYVVSHNENQVFSDGEELPPGVIFLPSPPPGRWKTCS